MADSLAQKSHSFHSGPASLVRTVVGLFVSGLRRVVFILDFFCQPAWPLVEAAYGMPSALAIYYRVLIMSAHAMTEPSLEKVYVRKLSRAYVALALAQDVAKRSVSDHSAHSALRPLLNILNVTAELLEEVLQDALPEESTIHSPPIQSSDLLM